ncbi:MAG: B12-binding domain-containing radical SAM protein [Methanomicrobiales archaeon]
MKLMFVEPPKDVWFVMGEYLPPPLGILELAAYLEDKNPNLDIQVLDCQVEKVDWHDLKDRIQDEDPDVLISSALSSCNTYSVLRALEIAKKIDTDIKTVVGGQHFTALAEESLKMFPEIDFIVRGEGEETLNHLIKSLIEKKPLTKVNGISFKHDGKIIHNPNRPLIQNLDSLPLPGYHFVEDYMNKYHFKMMAGDVGYALVEASRGCNYQCTFCSQWKHWQGKWRTKSPKRIAFEMEKLYNDYGSSFLWLTDDTLGNKSRVNGIAQEIINHGYKDDEIMWFAQARCDDIIKYDEVLANMRKSGNLWVMAGLERHDDATLDAFQKKTKPSQAKIAMDMLEDNGIFSQGTFIIGEFNDSKQSINNLREFVNFVDPDLAIFMILTPFPGTLLFEEASSKGWIEDSNWANYDMAHAIMPTKYLSTQEVQRELYECYRSFYGSMGRRLRGIFSRNVFKRKTYRYMASQGLLQSLRELF